MAEWSVRKLARAWWAATDALDRLPWFTEESAAIYEEQHDGAAILTVMDEMSRLDAVNGHDAEEAHDGI